MSATVIFAPTFEKGPSLFCDPGFVPQGSPYILNDPLYPEIQNAESVKVLIGEGPNGENVVDADYSESGTHVSASVHYGKRIWNFTSGSFQFEVWCRPTTEALDEGLFGAIPIWIGNDPGGGTDTPPTNTLWQLLIGGNDAVNGPFYADMDLEVTYSGQRQIDNVFTRAYIENRWIQFRVQGSIGTGVNTGWIKSWHRRHGETTWTPIHNLTSINWTSSTFSAVTFIAIGYAGMLGQSTGPVVWDGIPDAAADLQPLGQCCSTSGAAGGGTINPDGTVSPVGPRTGTAGGIAPSYTACSGGGELPATSDPTDPQSLDTVTDPILHLKLEVPAGDQYWGAGPINAGATSLPIEARVIRYSEIPSEVLAGRDGVIPTPSFTVRVADTDRVIRNWSQHATNRKVLGSFGEILAESYGQRKIDTEARKLAAGYVSDFKFLEDLVAEFTFADVLGWKRSALRRRVPIHTVTKDIFGQGVPEESLGRPIPWLYGELSDDYEWSLDNNRLPVGIVPCIPLGYAETIPFVNNLLPLGTGWQAFLIGKCCRTFRAQYMWNGSQDESVRARIPIDFPVIVDTMLPTQAGWASYWTGSGHVRVQAIDGTFYDFTMAFARGPRAHEAGTTQRFPLTFNMCGIEDVGDCTGDVFSDGATQLAHFIAYGVFSNHTYGPWGAIPTLPNGAPVINVTSLAATKAIFDLRLSGGYVGAFTVGATGMERRTGEEEITAKARGLDIQLGRNHFGQIVFDTVNDLASTSGLVAFDDSMMVDGSFHCGPRVDLQRNIARFTYGPEPATGRNTGLEQEIRDEDSIADYGEEGGDDVFLNESTRRKAVAEDVARRGLLRDSDIPYDGGFVTNLRGTSLSVGQLITVTTQWAHWPTTEAHLVKVTAVTPLGNEDELLTRIEFEDIHRLISTPSDALVGMTGPAWGQPIGSSVGLTSQPIGSSVAGTSRRLS